MGGLRRVLGQMETSAIPTQGIGFVKEKLLFQAAYATLPPGATYKAFPTAYGTPPIMSITEPGSVSLRTRVGTYKADILRVRPGSFQWQGTPSLNMHWFALGWSG